MSLGCPQLDPVKQFPASRTENRRILMDAVEEVGGVLEAGREEAEKTGTLPRASVEALEESGLLRLKLPRVLGGAEADLITQLDVLEAVSRIDSAAGWCLMIGAASVGSLAAFLSRRRHPRGFRGWQTASGGGSFFTLRNRRSCQRRVPGQWAVAFRQRNTAFTVGRRRGQGGCGRGRTPGPGKGCGAHLPIWRFTIIGR